MRQKKEAIDALKPDGLIFSNGPGNPKKTRILFNDYL